MKTKPTGARRAQRTKPQTNAAEAALQIDVARSVWNTLGAAKLLGLTPARVVRAVASGQLYSSRRIIGGDGKPRFAFSHGDLRAYADWLLKEGAVPGRSDLAYLGEREAALDAIEALTL